MPTAETRATWRTSSAQAGNPQVSHSAGCPGGSLAMRCRYRLWGRAVASAGDARFGEPDAEPGSVGYPLRWSATLGPGRSME